MSSVSVIIPCYNQGEFLRESIASCLKQKFSGDMEIIVVNDGSTDDTELIFNELSMIRTTRSLNLVNKENGGLSAARNTGIRASTGDWILCLDADDIIDVLFIEKTIGVSDIVTARARNFGIRENVWGPTLKRLKYKDFLARNRMPYCSLFQKKVWEGVGGYDENMKEGYEDWMFWLDATKMGFEVSVVMETLFLYRKRPGSMLEKAREKHKEITAYMKTRHPNIKS